MNKIYCTLILIIVVFSSCRKKIAVPDDSLKNLFGKWTWVKSFEQSGGYSTPASSGNDVYRIYTSKGVFEEYKNKSRQEKLNYTFSTSNGSFSNSVFTIVYKHRTFYWSEAHTTEYIHFKGTDTLYLNYGCDTCNYNMYVKQ
ncbi:MAG: hypothetical protein RJA07_1685 [Bacteroidota bacterium]